MSETNLNFNLIDPNKEILKGTPWYKSNDEGLGIPQFENIRSFVELSMKPKNPNFIELENGNIVNASPISDSTIVTLGGYYIRDNQSYYSTNYTDEIMGDNSSNVNRMYEGFGIKSVEITFDANKIPQVTVVFYDVRGNVVNDIESKYAKMFQLPYPIFTLTIKGGFGPTIDYRLLKIKDDIAVDELGNYVITSKFIGDRFSPLSDLPLLYLYPVPFLKDKDVNIFDTDITSFFELMQSSKRLFEKVNAELESDQEQANKQQITKIQDEKTSYENKLLDIQDKTNFLNWFKNDTKFKSFTKEIQDTIINYVNSCTFQNNKITFLSSSIALSQEFYKFISDTVKTKVDTLNGEESLVKINYSQIPALNTISGVIDVVTSIDYTELVDKVNELQTQLETNALNYSNALYTKISNLPSQELGDTKLTIGNIFKIIFDDYNWLMEKLWDIGKQGYERNKNQSDIDRMGFPTVIQKETNKIIYPGVIPQYREWPEIQFIENFIDAYQKAMKSAAISDTLLTKEEDGRSKYIPINPREIYTMGINGTDLVKKSVENIYYKKSPLEVYKLMYQRFLCFCNVNIDIDDDSDVYSKWNNTQNIEKDWIDSTKSFLGLTDFNDEIIKRGLFNSIIEMEARNIAYAISLDPLKKKRFTELSKEFNDTWFSNNDTDDLTKSIETIQNNTLPLLNNLKPFDDDYVTVSELEPKFISKDTQGGDIISTFMRSLHDANGGYKITKDNVLYIPDVKLGGNNNESDYEYDTKFYLIDAFNYLTLKQQVEENGNITGLFNFDYGIFKDITEYLNNNSAIFDFEKLYDNVKYPALVQVPRGILVILGGLLKAHVQEMPNNTFYKIKTLGEDPAANTEFTIKKDSKFYKFLLNEYEEFKNKHDFYLNWNFTNGSFDYIKMLRKTNKTSNNAIIEYIYQKRYISVNDLSFVSDTPNEVITNGITITNPKNNNPTLYKQYLKNLLPKIAQFVKDDDKKLNDKLNNFNSYIRDPEVKLAIYKSFQVIYENYLHGIDRKNVKLEVSNNESSSFVFVDRGYNNISGLDGLEPGCILDVKTLLNDINDYEVSLFSAIARLLSDNNFWFYPFSNFLTTTNNYNELFAINYDKKTEIKPKFIAMYVGGLSSNPTNTKEFNVKDDGIKIGDIPNDFKQVNTYSNGVLNAFRVKFTGIQNQAVFSNLQVSTESLKNTDEGLRIQSDIVRDSSNNYSIPKGQSLLNVYQKQSYSSTIKIPFGNMGIQPTQYYYQDYIPLFDGLYIIYNVSHSIDADTQRLETTFKGYRLKKDTNPIVTQQFTDFFNNNIYTQILNEQGNTDSLNAGSTTNLAFNPSDSFWINARRFVLGNEGFLARPYWDINNWRIGYGSEIMALNSALKAPDSERFDSRNFNKYYIRLPKEPTKWPQIIDLDTGKMTLVTLPVNHVRDYRYNTLKGNPSRGIPDKYQWDAGQKKPGDKFAGQEKNFYTRALADRAFDYTFNQFLITTRNVNPSGFDKLSQKGQIGVTYVSYGFGSIRDFMPKIKSAIASGNDTTLAIAIIEDIVVKIIKNTVRGPKQPYYRTAKYIEPDILNKLSSSTLALLKDKKSGINLKG